MKESYKRVSEYLVSKGAPGRILSDLEKLYTAEDLKEPLRLYADERNWLDGTITERDVSSWDNTENPATKTSGKAAREAIEKREIPNSVRRQDV